MRTRAAVGAALIMAICLTLAIGLTLLALYRSLAHSAEDAAAARSAQIADQIRDEPPSMLDPALLATDAQIGLIQVLDKDGRVVAASNGAPAQALVPTTVPVGEERDLGRFESADESLDFWLTARGATAAQQPVTVLVGADREPVESTIARVGALLAAGAPLVLAVAVVGTYLLVGTALRPVEAVRRQVSSISGSDLARRVPVPPTEDEVAQLARTMNEMLERLHSAQRTQQRFVSDASHELRSPLATITAALELAHGRPDLVDAAMIEDSLLPEARRMNELVADLLLLARADEDALALRRMDVDVDDVLFDEAARLSAAGFTVQTDIAPCRISGDPRAIARVARNLADNAARHAETTIELRCAYTSGGVRMVVADDGPGIPDDERERVFERFVRLDETRTRRSGGAGLGLAIVGEIVRAHHGRVAISERPGGGTVVTVELPSEERAT